MNISIILLTFQILVLLRQLNEKERNASNVANDDELATRLNIYDEQLSKFELLREELDKKDKLISDLQALVDSTAHRSKLNKFNSPVSKVIVIFYNGIKL